MRQLALDIGLAAAPDFDTFIPLGNERAVQVLRDLQPGHAPVYLWGPSGSGKSHLLRALQARLQRDGQRVAWMDASTDTAFAMPEDALWLLMDQAEGWTPAQQQAAFSAFVQITSRGGVVAAAGRLPAVQRSSSRYST